MIPVKNANISQEPFDKSLRGKACVGTGSGCAYWWSPSGGQLGSTTKFTTHIASDPALPVSKLTFKSDKLTKWPIHMFKILVTVLPCRSKKLEAR